MSGMSGMDSNFNNNMDSIANIKLAQESNNQKISDLKAINEAEMEESK